MEQSVEGTIAFLQHLQKYVARNDAELRPTLVSTDGLSCEQYHDAHNARENARSPDGRLEALEPAPQEFHKRMLLMQVNWIKCKTSSTFEINDCYNYDFIK